MIRPQLVLLHIDIELFGESVDGQRSEVSGRGVDIAQVVAGLVST
jgi:hypothetical protein